jgi:sigma-B regulation protein RsbU (phosphoserine phosphatase)
MTPRAASPTGLNRQRRTIALLVDSIAAEYTMLLRASAEREASRRNANLMIFTGLRLGAPRAIEATQNKIYELVTPERVDGVIVVSATIAHYCGAEGIEALCDSYSPLPICSVGLRVTGVPSLVVDNAKGMELGVTHLIQVHRRRRIAFIAGQEQSPESNLRLAGYRKALGDHGLPLDEDIIAHGEFTMPSGTIAMRKILERDPTVDAVVAANDYMALAAMEVLQESGRTVPGDVVVCGFDDANVAACARPSLTTLRQPLRWLGTQAVDLVLRQIDGQEVAECTTGAIALARRESCGCSGQLFATLPPSGPVPESFSDVLAARRQLVLPRLSGLVEVPSDALEDWPARLFDALAAELAGEVGNFSVAFEQLLEDAHQEGVSVDEFQRVITELRSELKPYCRDGSEAARELERLWHLARVLIGTAAVGHVQRERIEMEHAIGLLGDSSERLATTLSLPLLKQALAEELPTLNINQAAVSLFTEEDGDDQRKLRPLVILRGGKEIQASPEPFAPTLLAPDAALELDQSYHSVVLPLTFHSEFLGVAVLSSRANPSVYLPLRQQIGSAIKGAHLHRQVIEQVAARERAERSRLAQEAQLAAEIQTSMSPALLTVPGLEIAPVTIPVEEAGGDYHDVIPDAEGAWIGIGDVTGHGLGAGLVMLMLQSMIGALARLPQRLSPADLISAVNLALYDSVRHRLRRDDYASLTLVRYDSNGRLRFAGAHEPLILCRARTGRCELVEPPGAWTGVIPEVRERTEPAELTLEDGDLVVLYTDGVTEARNLHKIQFGHRRLTALIEQFAASRAVKIRDQIIEAVRDWSPNPDDDLTLVVMRYHATAR